MSDGKIPATALDATIDGCIIRLPNSKLGRNEVAAASKDIQEEGLKKTSAFISPF
jgi:hypothetical protein